jgi:hypothetical protein
MTAQVADRVCRCKHRLVLDGRHHCAHPGTSISRCQCSTDNAQVIGFGSAGGKNHLIRLGA